MSVNAMKCFKLCFITVMLLHCFSGITAFAQKRFTTKGIKSYVLPIYSINKMGIEKEPVFDNHDSIGVSQSRAPSGDSKNTVPATVSVKNNLNFAAGVDYEMWLPKKFFIAVSAEYRTLANDVRYTYDFDGYIKGYQFGPPFGDTFSYGQTRHLLSFGLHLGKNFKIANNEFEVKLGATIPFNLNKINSYVGGTFAWEVEQNGYSYILPYTHQAVYNFNDERSFLPENPRLHIYLGTNTKLSIFSKKPTKLSYGLQLNLVDGQDNKLRFITYYGFSMEGANVFYKTQITTFSYTKVMEIGLKVGVNLY